jgi:hypothetical protein
MSDDWVAKTGGLKLDSPLVCLGGDPLLESERWSMDATAEDNDTDTHEVVVGTITLMDDRFKHFR